MYILQLDDESMEAVFTEVEKTQTWIDNLRSGKYKQIQEQMCYTDIPNSACCLNVLECSVKGLKWNYFQNALMPSDKNDQLFNSFSAERFNGILAEKLHSTVVYSDDPEIEEGEELYPVQWNDDLMLTFNQIADLLEKGWIQVD